jgi:hypothetical protein
MFGVFLRSHDNRVEKQMKNTSILTAKKTSPLAAFDGRIVWKNQLAEIMDQQDCGACYAYAVTSALQDRFRLFSNDSVAPILNPLEAVMCHTANLSLVDLEDWSDIRVNRESVTQQTACKGGTLYEIARYFYRSGAVEQQCVSLETLEDDIKHSGTLPRCSDLTGKYHNFCSSSNQPPVAQRVWPILDFYTVSPSLDQQQVAQLLKHDICSKGPVVAGFNVYYDFLKDYTDGTRVYIPKEKQKVLGGHAVKIVGWGSQNQDNEKVDYWICANSWGKDWGDQGYFKLAMANPLLETEHNHLCVIPQIPGIQRFFSLTVPNSKVRIIDQTLRKRFNVNPYTLYTKKTVEMINNKTLSTDPRGLIFTQQKYTPSMTLLKCQAPSESSTPKIILVITLTILLILLLIIISSSAFF